MAVSYASQIYTGDRLFFVKLLFRWVGSVWQLLWIDYIIFCLLYLLLAVVYLNVLYTDAELKATFEVTVIWLKAIRTSVPLSFMLGFFVSTVFGRWWSVCMTIPWLHSTSFHYQALLDSPKVNRSDLARKLRITVLRYLNLAWILMMAGVSLHIKERFGYWKPSKKKYKLTWQRRLQLVNSDSKVQKYYGKMITDEEMAAFGRSADLSNDNQYTYDPEYWLPLMWASRLVRRAKSIGCIADERQFLFLVNLVNNFRSDLGTVWMYAEFNIPLVYTQVAVTAVYLFLVSTLISTQLVDSDILLEGTPPRNSTLPQRSVGLQLLSYLPVIGSLEFVFYLGWFKIGMCLLNPMGKDPADIPMSDILNSNLKASVKIGGAEDSIFPRGLTDTGEAEEVQVAQFLASFDFNEVHAHDKFGTAEQTERHLRRALVKRLQGRGSDWLTSAESLGGALLRRGKKSTGQAPASPMLQRRQQQLQTSTSVTSLASVVSMASSVHSLPQASFIPGGGGQLTRSGSLPHLAMVADSHRIQQMQKQQQQQQKQREQKEEKEQKEQQKLQQQQRQKEQKEQQKQQQKPRQDTTRL